MTPWTPLSQRKTAPHMQQLCDAVNKDIQTSIRLRQFSRVPDSEEKVWFPPYLQMSSSNQESNAISARSDLSWNLYIQTIFIPAHPLSQPVTMSNYTFPKHSSSLLIKNMSSDGIQLFCYQFVGAPKTNLLNQVEKQAENLIVYCSL